MQAFAIKAAREGKEQTSWLDPTNITKPASRLRQRASRPGAIRDIHRIVRRLSRDRVALMGALNSLAQVTLKATMPGVPDFYQGTELWDLSLVDPDNRRPVDFPARAHALRSLTGSAIGRHWRKPGPTAGSSSRSRPASWRCGRRSRTVFSAGDYRPLEVKGRDADEIVAFARCHDGEAVLVIVARLFNRSTHAAAAGRSRHDWDATVWSMVFLRCSNC